MSGFNSGTGGTGNPWDDLYANATGKNRFGEVSWLDPTQPITNPSIAENLFLSPDALLGSALKANNMRRNPRYGIYANRLTENLMPGMNILYSQLNRGLGTEEINAGLGEFASRLVSGYRGSGASEWLGQSGARGVLDDVFGGNLSTQMEEIVNDPTKTRDFVDFLTTVAYQGLTQPAFEAFQTQLANKVMDWGDYIAESGVEVNLADFIAQSGLLERFGLD